MTAKGASVSGSNLFFTSVIHLSNASSEPRAFRAGNEPTTPLLHCATVKSGLLTMNKGAPKAGSLSFARSWAATVFMAIFVTVSACCTEGHNGYVLCCVLRQRIGASSAAHYCRWSLASITARRSTPAGGAPSVQHTRFASVSMPLAACSSGLTSVEKPWTTPEVSPIRPWRRFHRELRQVPAALSTRHHAIEET